MTYKLKEETLNTVLNQLLAEIGEDRHMIAQILEDPTVVPHEQSVAYTLHKRIHHLAIHERAVEETYKLLDQLRAEKNLK